MFSCCCSKQLRSKPTEKDQLKTNDNNNLRSQAKNIESAVIPIVKIENGSKSGKGKGGSVSNSSIHSENWKEHIKYYLDGNESVDQYTHKKQYEQEMNSSEEVVNTNVHMREYKFGLTPGFNGIEDNLGLERKTTEIVINQSGLDVICYESTKYSQHNFSESVKLIEDEEVIKGGSRPKSCLLQKNPTKILAKKKGNIRSNAELTEAELNASASVSIAEDDEVFSDSVPPPKRESMCAPYVKKDELGYIQGLFGLPEWFNIDRIHDTDNFETPITPVGQDELELKRHRLYSELMRAAQVAVEQRVLNNPSLDVATNGDYDSVFKTFDTENLKNLVKRLEKVVERLERSLSTREVENSNSKLISELEKQLEYSNLKSTSIINSTDSHQFNDRFENIEKAISKLNELCTTHSNSELNERIKNISTVSVNHTFPVIPLPLNMSVQSYQDIINGSLNKFFNLSNKIGGEVAKQAELVKKAFNAQLQYIVMASQHIQPPQEKQIELLKPTSNYITSIQEFREKNRASKFFNHLSAISESIPALGWVCVSPTPGPHVKEMNDAGQFYTNRVLKEWKEKDITHVEWARSWIQTLNDMQQYIKQYHSTGLVWSGKNTVVGPPSQTGGPPAPPPPPNFDLVAMSLEECSADERSALFAEINQGEAITKNLKRVTAEMQTHRNPMLRTGPAPFKTPKQVSPTAATSVVAIKDPVFLRDGKKWIIEYQKNNTGLLVENAEMNNVVYSFKCENSTLTIKGKVNNIVMDSCKKCSVLFDSVVSSIEFVNCQSMQMQVLGFVPTISIDKTDGCQMYLSKESLGVEIISSKSSEMNVSIPLCNDDYLEQALPEQFKTTINGKTLKTVCIDSLG